jgi:hypothetical protein
MHFSEMNQKCEHCGVRLEPEPGFYQRAMYVSYGFTVVCMALISGILYGLGNTNPDIYPGVIGVMILIAPLNFRNPASFTSICSEDLKHVSRT